MRAKKLVQFRGKYLFFTGYGHNVFFVDKKNVLNGAGINKKGELGVGDREPRLVPTKVPLRSVKSVAIGNSHTVFQCGGKAFACGSNFYGQCSQGDWREGKFFPHGEGSDSPEEQNPEEELLACIISPQQVLTQTKREVIGVYAGPTTTYLLTKGGFVSSCGQTRWGSLGLSEDILSEKRPSRRRRRLYMTREHSWVKKEVYIATEIPNLRNIVHVETGHQAWDCDNNSFVYFLSATGRIFSCGYSPYGQTSADESGGVDDCLYVPTEVTYFNERNVKISWITVLSNSTYFTTNEGKVYRTCPPETLDTKLDRDFDFEDEFHYYSVPQLYEPMEGYDIMSSGNADDFVVFRKNGILYGQGRRGPESLSEGSCYYWGVECHSYFTEKPVEIASMADKGVEQIETARETTFMLCKNGTIFASGENYGFFLNGTQRDPERDSTTFVKLGQFSVKMRGESPARKQRFEFMACSRSILRNPIVCCE